MKLSLDAKVLDKLLQSMYRLPNRSVLHLQDATSCQQFVDLMAKCLEGVFQYGIDEGPSEFPSDKDPSEGLAMGVKEPPKGFSVEEANAVRHAITMIKSKLDLRWVPEYGSAIIFHRGDLQMPGMMSISIIGLDKYSFFLHGNESGSGYSNEADATDFEILCAGTIEEDKVPSFWDRFQQLLSAAKEREGDRRTAAGGRQGHQFTPTLIRALAIQAVNCACDGRCTCFRIVPQGGFTDNGRHTGGKPRNTSFALAKFLMLKWPLAQFGFVDGVLFRKVMLRVHLSILFDQVLRGEEAKQGAEGQKAWKVRANLDIAFRILEVISIDGAELDEIGVSINFIFQTATELRSRMNKIVEELTDSEAKRFTLPDVDSLLQNPESFRSPRLHIPATEVSNFGLRVQDYDDRMKKNIGPTDLFEDKKIFDLTKLLLWLKASHFRGNPDHITVLLRLRTVENVFWTRALQGFDKDYLDSRGLGNLFDTVKEYRRVFHYFEGGLDKGWLDMVELRSRELLIVWIAYCLAFAASKYTYGDVMSKMSVALKSADLEHLKLSDKRSWEVLKKVARFLDQNHQSENTELFSFRSHGATRQFALEFATNETALRNIMKTEKNDAESRMDKHWEEVVKKQNKAKQLRSEIESLNHQLRYAEQERDDALASYHRKRRYDAHVSRFELNECESKVISLMQKLGSCKNSLKAVLQAPSPVCQPLPRGDNNALQWLFFLYMPPNLRVLSTLSFMGQQMLVPRPWKARCDGPDGTDLADVMSALRVSNGECLVSFYNTNQSCEFHRPLEDRLGIRGDVAFVSPTPLAEVRPKKIGPSSVDHMVSREDGVWFPDNVTYNMQWTGGSLSLDQHTEAFDPFRVQRNWVVSYFTEKLGSEAQSLQWAMHLQEYCSSDADERGNRPLACQQDRPHWLSRTQFLAFCNMRAFPCKQLRNVFNALLERSVPLQRNCVRSLLKQTLFHVGKLVTGGHGDFHLGWKYDLADGNFLATARAILKNLEEEISESPSSYLSVLAVGDISCFLSEWDSDSKEISRRLAHAVFGWAEEFGRQAESAEKTADSIGFRLRQRTLLGISLLCLVQGPMNANDNEFALKCRAISKNLCVDKGEDTDLRGDLRTQLSGIERRCDSAIAHCVGNMLEVFTKRLSFLTHAIRAVIASVPDGLVWRIRGPSSSSFMANGSDGCVYAINILTGTVLVNGLPPSSLPSDILQHELYRRNFGDKKFEVVSKNEVYETVRRTGGFLYRFTLKNDNKLCIMETSEIGEMFELLDSTENGIELWAKELPERLKKMHSHWLCRDSNTIILRGREFYDRNVHFVIKTTSDGGAIVSDCYVVPAYLRSDQWRKIADSSKNFPRLVLHESPLLALFTKYERPEFVHFIISEDTISSKSFLVVSLPRHGLTFSYFEGQFLCDEISGCFLAKCQQLEGTLFGFEQYLVIQKNADHLGGCSKSIIVVDGDIMCSKLDGSTNAATSLVCDEDSQWHKYDLHPRFHTLSAGTVSSRLYLAALHTSTSFLSPDSDSLLTGFERAIELVRESWVARALSCQELTCLTKLASVCRGKHPSLSLLCTELMQSSVSVASLHLDSVDHVASHDKEWKVSLRESMKYANDLKTGLLNHRNCLNPLEERRILGQRCCRPTYKMIRRSLILEPAPVQKGVGKQMEDEVQKLCGSCNQNDTQFFPPEFPLRHVPSSTLEADIVSELHDSWVTDQKLSAKFTFLDSAELDSKIVDLHGRTKHHRMALEDYIQAILNNKAGSATPSGEDLKRLSRLHPRATPRDPLLFLLHEDLRSKFNTSLSEQDKKFLQACTIEWLRLCVVEDKLVRLSGMAGDGQGFERELRMHRNWDPSKKPAWLVFEVEHSLQIWPEQAAVAMHLIKNRGDIVQLNMGMGKTRVIIPLLVLHWAFHCNGTSIPRINVLPQLLSEACSFFHRSLTASIFNVKLVPLPFSRDVQLNTEKILSMQSLLALCEANSGFVIVAPEHRLSLELKIKELELGGKSRLAAELRKMHARPWIDILDESDELLHHRFQLTYAIGSVQGLPAGIHRWQAAQALLIAIQGNHKIDQWLEEHKNFAVRPKETTKEAFRPILITSQMSMSALIPDFLLTLAKAVLARPPHEMEWMRDHTREESILDTLVNEAAPPECIDELSEDQRSAVLALRGLLVGGILVHCLRKRHRVDYGVARPGKKKLSVPFRGADTPSLRSEFSHPDCAIVYTILAYYEDGLTEAEVISAFSALFILGRNVQRKIYSQWYSLSKEHIETQYSELCSSLDMVEKIDLANQVQLRHLFMFYRQNIRVIGFWLNACVFPEEMQYYPQRLSATSWNLAENTTHIVGFSGTNDNHRLLPLQVKQYFPDLDSSDPILQSLASTNGRMVETILNRTISCLCLTGCNKVDSICRILLNQKAQAIIDAGALLAGLSNEEMARTLIAVFDSNGISTFKGVLYFDNMSPHGEWMALEPSGRLLPKNRSPVQESEAFAIFDEPRCRGADLKLNRRAVALLTIGPRMCKEKLMQAAGRMRSLSQGQSLVIVGMERLFAEICETRESPRVTQKEVLEWTLCNTVKANTEGLLPWADQGLSFCTSRDRPDLSVEDEKLSLEEHYGGAFHDVSIAFAVEKARSYHSGRANNASSIVRPNDLLLINKILGQAERYGSNTVRANCSLDEECERELELEREVEEEKEVEIPRMTPAKEVDWDKSLVLEASSPSSLSGVVGITTLNAFISDRLHPPQLSRFAWSDLVYGTSNFFSSVKSQSGLSLSSYNHYLRSVDVFLAFPSREVLLVSDREADELIDLLWKQGNNTGLNVSLCHFSPLRSSLDGRVNGLVPNSLVLGRKWSRKRRLSSSISKWEHPCDAIVATLQLFAGETSYSTISRQEALKDILRGHEASRGPVVADPAHLVDSRGNSHLLQYSDLERACRELAREKRQVIEANEGSD